MSTIKRDAERKAKRDADIANRKLARTKYAMAKGNRTSGSDSLTQAFAIAHGARVIDGPFGSDVAMPNLGEIELKFKASLPSGNSIETTPNEANAVNRAIARKAWVAFVEYNRKGFTGRMEWYRADNGAVVPIADRVRENGRVQSRACLRFDRSIAIREIPI